MRTTKTQKHDVVTIVDNLLRYLKGNPSCWNKIEHDTGYSGREIASGMNWLDKLGYGKIITHRDDESAPWYAPTEVRHLYEINDNVIDERIKKLESDIELLKTIKAGALPQSMLETDV